MVGLQSNYYLFTLLVLKQQVSIEFYTQHRAHTHWDFLVKCTHYEEFLNKFKYFLDWRLVSKYQTLSKPFIKTLLSAYDEFVGMTEECGLCKGIDKAAVAENPCNHVYCKKCQDKYLELRHECSKCGDGLIIVLKNYFKLL